MNAELTGYLGYERGDPAPFSSVADTGRGSGNSSNGTTPKRIGTEVGDIAWTSPRTATPRASRLVPRAPADWVASRTRIISLYSGGMTIHDIQHHLAATLGTELSHQTITKITEADADEVAAWQWRPLEAFYPVLDLDALVVEIRDGAHVSKRAGHIAVGLELDGDKRREFPATPAGSSAAR